MKALHAGIAAFLLASCSRPVQTPVHQFDVPAPPNWQGGETAPQAADTDWWAYFGDDGLDAVVERALDCNQALRAASARIEAARQQYRIAGAAERPEVSLGINRIRQRQNFVGLPFPGLAGRVLSNTFTNAGLSLNVAWEADIWNRVAAGKLAAEADAGALTAERQAAMLSLSGQTAKAWFAAIEAQHQIDLANSTLENARVTAERTLERFRAGTRSPLDVRMAQADVARFTSIVKQREQMRAAFVRQVETLACEYPAGEQEVAGEFPTLDAAVPAGLPSELVHRRPDLLAGEQALLAADARIVQARAALRPSFSLTTGLGTSSDTLLDVVDPNLQVWNYALGLAQPLFNRGRLKAGVRASQARSEEAAANYEDRLRRAYLEVETALSSEAILREQEQALRSALESTRQAIRLAEARYRSGLSDIFILLTLRRTALDTESALLALRRTRIDNRVDLHLALGGSFSGAPADPAPDSATF